MRSLVVFLALIALSYIAWSSRHALDSDDSEAARDAAERGWTHVSADGSSNGAGTSAAAPESRAGQGTTRSLAPGATRRAIDDATETLEAPAPALVFEIDGESAREFRALWLDVSNAIIGSSGPRTDGRIPLTELRSERVLLAHRGRRSALVDLERDPGKDLVVRALPTYTVVGNVVDGASAAPVTDASVQAFGAASLAPVEAWLAEQGVATKPEAVVDVNGRFSFEHLEPGEYVLHAASPSYAATELFIAVSGDVDLGPILTLVHRPRLAVRLEGAPELRAGAYVAHTILGTKAWVDEDGSAQVLLDPKLEALDIAVGLSDGCELTAFLQGSAGDYPDGVTIPIEGRAGVEVGFTGVSPVEDRLLALVYFVAHDGHEVFANRFVEVGERVLFACCEPGTIWVDAAIKRVDRSPLTLARRGVNVDPGEIRVVTIELPEALRYVRLLGSSGAPISPAEVWFATGSERHLSTPGGAVDAGGRIVLPDMDAATLSLSGTTGEAGDIAFIDVQLDQRATAATDLDVLLGAVERTRLQLIDKTLGQPIIGQWVQCVGRMTGHVGAEGESDAEGSVLIQWYGASDALVQLDAEQIWSPRGPIPLVPGELQVKVELRAWCQFVTGGRPIEMLEREGGDATRASLIADPSVRHEEIPQGERWWGIPAGKYRVKLQGDTSWRGPFAVSAREWTTITLD
ncbi:MAG: carboxypeptidase-like regulatory domain-containing protein [Planctomycetota bacterium]